MRLYAFYCIFYILSQIWKFSYFSQNLIFVEKKFKGNFIYIYAFYKKNCHLYVVFFQN